MSKRSSGHITVFLSIILLAIFTLAGVLVDLSRIHAGNAMIRSAVRSAADSLLADYRSRLKENYGIFAISAADPGEIEDQLEEYLSCDLSIPTEEGFYTGKTDLYDFRIESIQVTPMFNLSENAVMKQQILEYMKYRAPEKLAEGFIERLSSFKKLGSMSEAYKKKVVIDKQLGVIDKSQQQLKKLVDGDGNSNRTVNGFDAGGVWEAAFDRYNTAVSQLSGLQSELLQKENSITETEKELDARKLEDAEDTELLRLKDLLVTLSAEKQKLTDQISSMGSILQNEWNELRYKQTENYIHVNDLAIEQINYIKEKGAKAQSAVNELERFLETNFKDESDKDPESFAITTKAELEKLKAMILEGDQAKELLASVQQNKSILSDAGCLLDSSVYTSDSGPCQLPDTLLQLINGYAGINYTYTKPSAAEEAKDPRKGIAGEIKKLLNETVLKDVDYTLQGIDPIVLPSRTKATTAGSTAEEEKFSYEGNLGNLGEDADLNDEGGMFQENALGYLAEIGKSVSKDASAMRDNIFLNEYILGTFKNAVPVRKKEQEDVADTNLHGSAKCDITTFYDCETEYILQGNSSQNLNNLLTKGELLLVRFGLNTLHVYMDPQKRTLATSIAASVAGWWTGGLGIPIVSNLVMCGWSLGESLIDVQELLAGKSVPLYKLKGDWQLEIGLPKSSGPAAEKGMYMDYYEYLRIFLLVMNENKKLDRIEDLIQLNLGMNNPAFRMTGCNTYMKVEATVSMKYLFLTQPFVKKELNTGDGRATCHVLYYAGY